MERIDPFRLMKTTASKDKTVPSNKGFERLVIESEGSTIPVMVNLAERICYPIRNDE